MIDCSKKHPFRRLRRGGKMTGAGLAGLLVAGRMQAQEADKIGFTLLNPVPANQMRSLSVSATDGVIDPFTVDAGHAELQGDLVNYRHYSLPSLTENELNWTPRLSVGLLNRVEAFVRPEFLVTHIEFRNQPGTVLSQSQSRFTYVNVGSKVNLWGNDGGVTAFSLAPYLAIPTEHRPWLGGGNVSLAARLPWDCQLKYCGNPYVTADSFNVRHAALENNLSLHKTVGGQIDTYAYVNTSCVAADGVPWVGYAGFGLGREIGRNGEIFASLGFGFSYGAASYNPRVGMAWRF